jgi:magnesium chelatase subunit D
MIDPDQVGRRGQEALAARRVVGVSHVEHTGTLAVTQSLQVAAGRGARVALRGVALERDDLRQHQRRGPGRCHVLFLVDASGSMATQRRLQLAKSAALGLLASSYQRRDEVALMVFRGEGSELVLPFTRHTAKIEQALREVPTGGRTPLARALLDARDVLRTRQPSLLVLLTDGRANVALEFGDPWQEALTACAALKSQCGAAWVIDCELGPVTLGRAQMLAQALGASCIALDALDGDGLALRIRQRVETP